MMAVGWAEVRSLDDTLASLAKLAPARDAAAVA